MRVAHVVPRFPTWSQGFILDQLTGLLDRGCEVEVYAWLPGDPAAHLHPDVFRYGLPERTHYRVPRPGRARRALRAVTRTARHGWRPPRPLLRAGGLRRFGRQARSVALLAAEAPGLWRGDHDVVHCHFGNAALAPALLREWLGLRAALVTSFYGHDASRVPRRLGADCYAPLFARGDCFLALSGAMARRLASLGCPPERLAVHHLAVRCDEIGHHARKLEPGERVRLLCAARLVEKKGIRFAVRAAAELRGRGLDVELAVAGDGPERSPLEALGHELGLAGRIRWLGPLAPPEVIREMQRAHLFVHPSATAADGDEEGTPTAILEAMATGLPVVATRHAGIPEQVEDGVSGALVPERDAGALADRLARLIAHPERWPDLGFAGRRRVEAEFDASRQSDALLARYRELADSRPRARS